MSDNIFFPSVEEINNDWGPGEVIAFLETHKKKLFLRDVDIKPIKNNWVAGEEEDDELPRKRPRLIRALDGKQIFDDSISMSWTDQEKGVFVDKSLFIIEYMIYSERAILITRPRRFGKSTNLSMLYTFLKPVSEKEKEQKLALFKDLKVSKFDWFIKLNLGNWPVIYISFKDLNYESWESMLSSIRKRISDLYKEHRYIIDNKKLHEDDESLFRKTLDGKIDNSYLMDALSSMSRYLHEYFGKQIIILIDEYDWSMEHAGSFYSKANIFFKCMYSSIAKDNQHVSKVLFVGILPLGQASFLSGLNNVGHYPMHILPGIHGRAHYSDMFGFTEKEVEFLLSKSNRKFELDNLRTHYNGYRTSTNKRIYNPHSIMSFLQKDIVGNYWTNSGSTFTVKKYLKKLNQDQLQSLYYAFYSLQDNDNHVKVKLVPHFRYDVLESEPEINAIYTLLCYSGYLTVNFDDKFNNEVDKQWKPTEVELIIPNREVAEQWKQWIIDFIEVDQLMTNIFNSLFKKDIKAFCEQFSALYMEITSCFGIGDSKRAKLYEDWYHTFILGALAMFHSNDYQVVSNCGTGKGCPDVRIIPINPKFDTCIIFEFKLAKSKDLEVMRKLAREGLKQITDKNYRSNTASHIESIVEVAIAFNNKSTFVSAQCLQHKKGEKKGKLSTHDWEIVSSAESRLEG
ncbi:31_t:CDS:2 [Gigaspora margarita]|uniref:31_t:CDS:1 n=1 Tax=Gigaspora margarita TaxID=4874 RepID=A0ABN7UAH7_GIGMA|nr:31_t:CDS:2 [Gigaspora margarita]